MADGDASAGTAASAIGLAVMTGIETVKIGWRFINSTRDMIANHMTAGTHTAAQIVSGVLDAARIPSLDGSKIATGMPSFSPAVGVAITWDGVQFNVSTNLTASGNIYTSSHLYAPNMTPVVSGYAAVYRNSDGRVGISPSSRRFKEQIQSWSPDKQAVLALQLVQFRYKAAVWDGEGEAPIEYGVIAEQLIDLGLDWLVFFDKDGQPLGVHYERIALALLPVIQDHEARLAKLEGTTNA